MPLKKKSFESIADRDRLTYRVDNCGDQSGSDTSFQVEINDIQNLKQI